MRKGAAKLESMQPEQEEQEEQEDMVGLAGSSWVGVPKHGVNEELKLRQKSRHLNPVFPMQFRKE